MKQVIRLLGYSSNKKSRKLPLPSIMSKMRVLQSIDKDDDKVLIKMIMYLEYLLTLVRLLIQLTAKS